jgi:hypothetical protein
MRGVLPLSDRGPSVWQVLVTDISAQPFAIFIPAVGAQPECRIARDLSLL